MPAKRLRSNSDSTYSETRSEKLRSPRTAARHSEVVVSPSLLPITEEKVCTKPQAGEVASNLLPKFKVVSEVLPAVLTKPASAVNAVLVVSGGAAKASAVRRNSIGTPGSRGCLRERIYQAPCA